MKSCLIVLHAALVAVMVSGCLQSDEGSVTVNNNHGTEAIGLRVRLPTSAHYWIFQAQQIDTVAAGPSGAIVLELVAPVTCEVVAAVTLDGRKDYLVLANRGVTGEGPWELSVSEEDATPSFEVAPPTQSLAC